MIKKELTKHKEILFIVFASIIAGFIAKLPVIFSLDEEFFYPRNIGFIIFPVLALYFSWKNQLSATKIASIAAIFIVSAVYINLLPNVENDTLILACIHLILLMWSILGFAFTGEIKNALQKRLGYLKYSGDLAVITTLILISGGLLSAITIALFELIDLKIADFYFQNIGIFGLVAAPIVGTYLIQTNPQLIGKVSPLIAKIFSPLVLVMLVVYLTAIIFSGKDPYNNREFLLIFNILLIGVMALIFFSAADTTDRPKTNFQNWILFLLSAVTIIVNGVALSAIVFRISEWGITPNRAAVLGANLLILINLIIVTIQLYKVISHKSEINTVGETISRYLPIYVIWTAIVTFLFPLIF
ncbi:MAG: hypothetical protein CVU13_04965 [Bacteroidetes bacterium HGW-Bacteroidetes-8]|jgi:hypothetical protein|nr:MAG: hypothetical protein CVU13_04965 [Bacteroidetes bacterium HGW-Bacteroidetes-8]